MNSLTKPSSSKTSISFEVFINDLNKMSYTFKAVNLDVAMEEYRAKLALLRSTSDQFCISLMTEINEPNGSRKSYLLGSHKENGLFDEEYAIDGRRTVNRLLASMCEAAEMNKIFSGNPLGMISKF